MQGFLKKKFKNKVKQLHKIRLKIDSKLTKNFLKNASVKTLLNE